MIGSGLPSSWAWHLFEPEHVREPCFHFDYNWRTAVLGTRQPAAYYALNDERGCCSAPGRAAGVRNYLSPTLTRYWAGSSTR